MLRPAFLPPPLSLLASLSCPLVLHAPAAFAVQALKLSSEIPYDEAVDMQGFPDSFM